MLKQIISLINNEIRIPVKYGVFNIFKLAKIQKGDWIDLYAQETKSLKAGDFYLVPLGVAMKLPEGYEAHLVPRSSTFKNTGLIQTNSMGIIDNTYCGDGDEWKMPVYATRDTEIKEGDRLCQFRVVKNQPKIKFIEVPTLNSKDRGGFGSTGR